MISYGLAVRSFLGTREEQQDYAVVNRSEDSVFAVVCDGMGGLNGGILASSLTAEALLERYKNKDKNEAIADFYLNAVDILDENVFRLTDDKNEKLNAGTTVVSVCAEGCSLNWFSVGDSRLYIVRGDEIVQATRDHNYFLKLDEMLKTGEISDEEYLIEKQRGEALISFIGMGGIEVMDISQNPLILKNGDKILITTDGLFKILTDEHIKNVLKMCDEVEKAADILLEDSINNSGGNQDNTTFVLISFKNQD